MGCSAREKIVWVRCGEDQGKWTATVKAKKVRPGHGAKGRCEVSMVKKASGNLKNMANNDPAIDIYFTTDLPIIHGDFASLSYVFQIIEGYMWSYMIMWTLKINAYYRFTSVIIARLCRRHSHRNILNSTRIGSKSCEHTYYILCNMWTNYIIHMLEKAQINAHSRDYDFRVVVLHISVIAPRLAFLYFVHFEAKIMSVFSEKISVTGKKTSRPPVKKHMRVF